MKRTPVELSDHDLELPVVIDVSDQCVERRPPLVLGTQTFVGLDWKAGLEMSVPGFLREDGDTGPRQGHDQVPRAAGGVASEADESGQIVWLHSERDRSAVRIEFPAVGATIDPGGNALHTPASAALELDRQPEPLDVEYSRTSLRSGDVHSPVETIRVTGPLRKL